MANEGGNEGGLHLFGRNVSGIPCYRDSLMTGIGGGIVTGLGFFLFTSNVRKATNFCFGSFVGLTLVAWSVCRSKRKVPDEAMIKKAIQTKILTEGTELGKQIEAESKDV